MADAKSLSNDHWNGAPGASTATASRTADSTSWWGWLRKKKLFRWIAIAVGLYLAVVIALGIYWSRPPETFDVITRALIHGDTRVQEELVPGFVTASTATRIAWTLLHKRGGYLRNDIFPPGVLLDNMPAWEFGALTAVRDIALVMRNDFARSQSQSLEDPDLAYAQPQFNFDAESWILPATEDEYAKGISAMEDYLVRLQVTNTRGVRPENPAQFFVRSDNLRDWINFVIKRLGNYSQRLSAAVGRVDFATLDEPRAQSTEPGSYTETKAMVTKTSWWHIDNVYYEARGYSWALLHIMEALEHDFQTLLANKNAEVSMLQVIRGLRQAVTEMYSPIVLNGEIYGVFANHSLTMASFLAQANAAAIDLRNLLMEG